MLPDLLRGIMLGFMVAMPVGPVCLLCLNYAITRGFKIALAAAIGTSLADAAFALFAILGVDWVSPWLMTHGALFCMLSAIFLTYLGILALRSKDTAEKHRADQQGGKLKAALTLFFITIANPLTILTFATLIGSMGVAFAMGGMAVTTTVVLGVFIGSVTWWIVVTGFVSKFRHKMTPSWIVRFRKIGGSALLIFAGLSLLRALIA